MWILFFFKCCPIVMLRKFLFQRFFQVPLSNQRGFRIKVRTKSTKKLTYLYSFVVKRTLKKSHKIIEKALLPQY